jgi:uncharacterized membrane protein
MCYREHYLSIWPARYRDRDIGKLSGIIIAVFIGGVLLSAIYGAPLIPTMTAIAAGELVSCVGIGLPLLMALDRAIGHRDKH